MFKNHFSKPIVSVISILIMAMFISFSGKSLVFASNIDGANSETKQGTYRLKLAPDNNAYNLNFMMNDGPDIYADLNQEENAVISKGQDVELVLYAKKYSSLEAINKDTSELDKSIYSTKIDDNELKFISYLEISLYKEAKGDSPIKNQVTETKSSMMLILDAPETDYKTPEGYERNYYIFALHNDTVSMEGPYIASGGIILIDLRQFSTFALTYVDLPQTTESAPNFDYSYNGPATSVEEIREKIKTMTSPSVERNAGDSLISSTYSPGTENNYIAENETESEKQVVSENHEPAPKKIPFKTIIMILILVDLVLLLTLGFSLPKRGKGED